MRQKGQVALIALLVLTVAATVGLSLVARTTTDLSTTRSTEDSTRAFSAAEAGIEESLKSGVGSTAAIDSSLGIRYSVTPVPVSGSVASPLVLPQKTLKENTETVWLVDHYADGSLNETRKYTQPTIDVCWSNESPTPAVVVSVLYKKLDGTYQVARSAFDSDGARAAVNNFSAPTPGSGNCPTNTSYRGAINFASLGIDMNNDILIALRIRLIYNGAQIAVAPLQDLPVQGVRIVSTGTAAGGVNRKIVVYQQYRAPESIFDYAVYSEGDL